MNICLLRECMISREKRKVKKDFKGKGLLGFLVWQMLNNFNYFMA